MEYGASNSDIFNDFSAVPPSYSGYDLTRSASGPFPNTEHGVKFRPLAFYDRVDQILPASKIPGNGTRVAGTTFYIRIEKAIMEKFVKGQVCKMHLKYEDFIRFEQQSTREQYTFLLRFADMSSIALGNNILEDDIPSSMRLTVNQKEGNLPPHIPPSKAGVEPKRQKKPVVITPQVRPVEMQRLIIGSKTLICIV